MPKFSLVTLNCFGVPAPNTGQRLRALLTDLDQRAADVVCLQEVQTHPYRRLLMRTSTIYKESAYEPFLHAPKGGLLTLARHKIEKKSFMLYRERGLWYTPALTDWILHKGILITYLTYDAQPMLILNTHLTANYTANWERSNAYARHEREQLIQLAELILAQPPETLIIVAGDFNVPRGSWLLDEFLQRSGLTDPLSGDMRPTLRPPSAFPARYAAAIDYALVRPPPGVEVHMACRMCYHEKMALANGTGAYLSDHNGLALSLAWGASLNDETFMPVEHG